MKFHLWIKCLATSVAALPYTAVPMSCQGMRGVFMRSTPSKGWKQHAWVRISRGGVQDGRKKNEKWMKYLILEVVSMLFKTMLYCDLPQLPELHKGFMKT